mgnify:CR=1 FL=1
MSKHKPMSESRKREMALVDWVKQAMFDAMKIWIDDHEDELSELIVKSLSERIEITFLPNMTIRAEESTEEINETTNDGEPSPN